MDYRPGSIACGLALVLAAGLASGGHAATIAGAGTLAESGCAASYGLTVNGTLHSGVWSIVTRVTPASPPTCLSVGAATVHSWQGPWNATTGGCIVNLPDILCMENPQPAGGPLMSYDVALHGPPLSAQGRATVKLVG